jgi:hypothetical protein
MVEIPGVIHHLTGLISQAGITLFPQMIIYCQVSERKIDKEIGNIYDNASEETLSRIDKLYEEALKFIETYPITQEIKVIRFFNDFTKTVNKNVDNLIKQLKKEFN